MRLSGLKTTKRSDEDISRMRDLSSSDFDVSSGVIDMPDALSPRTKAVAKIRTRLMKRFLLSGADFSRIVKRWMDVFGSLAAIIMDFRP